MIKTLAKVISAEDGDGRDLHTSCLERKAMMSIFQKFEIERPSLTLK